MKSYGNRRSKVRTLLLATAAIGIALGAPGSFGDLSGLGGVAHAQGAGQGAGGPGGGGGGQGGGQGGSHGQRGPGGAGGGGNAGGGGTSAAAAGGAASGAASTAASGAGTGAGSAGSRGAASPGSGSSMGQGGAGGGVSADRGHNGGSTGESTGDETDSDKKGPRFGGGENTRKPGAGTQGGRPAWAKEGIPAVELGRLSVARAPASVLEHSFTETIANWATMGTTVLTLTAPDQPTLQMTVAQLYSLPALEFANIVQTYYDSVVRIDSPLENLALMKNLAITGTTALTGVTPSSTISLEAIFLGSASDKSIAITPDTVTAMNTILALPALTEAQTAELAAEAEAVRLAILSGHSS